jgi:hypothetical protein
MFVMKFYESIQANSGQLLAGVGIPGTDIEISRPPIPVTELHFDNNFLAVVGTVALAGGIYWSARHNRATIDYVDTVNFPQGSDTGKRVRKNGLAQGKRNAALGLFLTGAVASGLYNTAGPHTEEKINKIDSVAVVIDAGYESYAKDVVDSETDEPTERVLAAANTLIYMEDLEGIDVNFVAAGREPINIGSISDQGIDTVVSNFNVYINNDSNMGSPSNGGGDVETALSIAEATNPDKILVLTGSLEGQSQSYLLVGQEIEGKRDVSVIAIGTPGSKYGEFDAPINVDFNQKVVGVEDSYSAASTNELENVVSEIIDNEIQTDVRNDIKIFEKLAIASTALLAGLTAYVLNKSDRILRSEVKKNRK